MPTKPKKRGVQPWAKKNLLQLQVGGKIGFIADPEKHRAIRKQASVTGEENGIRYSVRVKGSNYVIERTE